MLVNPGIEDGQVADRHSRCQVISAQRYFLDAQDLEKYDLSLPANAIQSVGG